MPLLNRPIATAPRRARLAGHDQHAIDDDVSERQVSSAGTARRYRRRMSSSCSVVIARFAGGQ